jgi:hypothetical protein
MTGLWIGLFVVVVIGGAVIKVRGAGGGAASNARLRGYGIVVDGSEVKSGGYVVGPLAGATAQVTDGTSRHTLTRVVTVAGALTKKTTAHMVISLANGQVRTHKLNTAGEIRQAQVWAVKFNALAGQAAG